MNHPTPTGLPVTAINGCVLIEGVELDPCVAADLALAAIDTQPVFARLVARACQRAEVQRAETRAAICVHGGERFAHDSERDQRPIDWSE